MNAARNAAITYLSLIDALRPHRVIQRPASWDNDILWVSSIHWERGVIPEQNMAIVCKQKAIARASKLFPEALLIVLAKDENDTYDDPSLTQRTVVVKAPNEANILQQLQNLFLRKLQGSMPLTNLQRHSTYALFDDLVNDRYVGGSYLAEYASLYAFSLDSEFRLLRFKQNTDDSPARLAQSAHAMNRGKCLVTIYENDLFVLLHSKQHDDSLSNYTIYEQLEDLGLVFDGYIAISQVFNNITNLRLAYQQTNLVETYRSYIDFGRTFSTAQKRESQFCYTFEEALMFALVDSDVMTEEMKDFAFSHTILEKIIAEDAATGSEDARILAAYLHHERKATVVAEKLHMHRNTVLYRIDKLEKRFGLDFSKSWSRDRVNLDLTILYCRLMRDARLRSSLFENSLTPLPDEKTTS